MLMKELKEKASEEMKSEKSENHCNLSREFDFFGHVYDILLRRSNSDFINYHDLYSYLGRRFCLKKSDIKQLLRSLQIRGFLVLRKKGVYLLMK
ncbi:MAG: hypothetical protein ACETWM_17310 [Candidatus Lokiarchaeia archaeon]